MKDNPQKRKFLKFLAAFLGVLALVCATAFALKFSINFFTGGIFGTTEPTTMQETAASGPAQTQPPTLPTETQPPETEAPTEPRSDAETARATITVTGDVMMHLPVVNSGKTGNTYNYDQVFSYISDYVNQADYAVANLETTLAGLDNGYEYSGFPRFNCPDTITDAIKNAGFDMLLSANNHSYDTDTFGMKRTLSIIKDRGLETLGTMETADEPKYKVLDINGIKVGMLCYTYGEIDASTGKKAVNGIPMDSDAWDLINVFDYTKLDRFYEEMETHIADMRSEGAEAIVLFIHWGVEYQTYANDYQTEIAQKMCDLGVDVIAGGHPHVIQPAAWLTSTIDSEHNTLCVYSMGNCLSNQRAENVGVPSGHTEDGMLFSFTFVKYKNGEVYLDSADILPTWVRLWYNNGQKTYTILPLDEDVTDWAAAFSIDTSTYSSAEASYARTMKLVGDGLSQAQTALAEAKEEREAVFAGA